MIAIKREAGYYSLKKSNMVQKWDTLFMTQKKYRDLNEVFVSQIIEEFKLTTGMNPRHVVDLGCGTGETLAKFCKLGFDVTGIDFSMVALKNAKILLSSFDKSVTLIEADMENLDRLEISVPAGALWLCKLTLAFIKDKTHFLKNIREKMNSNDMFFLMTPVLHDNIIYKKEDKPGIALRVEESNSLMLEIFGNKQIFNNEYPGDRGHIISYLVKRSR